MIKIPGEVLTETVYASQANKANIKVWVLADSHNGYFSRFEVYTGKKGNTAENNLGTGVVKTLTAELKGEGPSCLLRQLLHQ